MDERIKNGSRVKLRGHIGSEFYNGLAKTGNEGWITQHRIDRNGLPEVWVQWDRTHWADNDQPDRWTYEEHFDILEEPKMAEYDPAEVAKAMKLMKLMESMEGDSEVHSTPTDPEMSDIDAEMKAHYVAQAEKARQLIDGAEAFVLVSVSRQEDESSPLASLQVGLARSSMTPETDMLVGAQLSALAAGFHEHAAMMNIEHLTLADGHSSTS